jgi:hypothetical protein
MVVGVITLGVLLFVYRAMQHEPAHSLESAYTLKMIEELERIEIEPPKGIDGAQRLLLERREDGWWLREPVQAPVSRERRAALDEAFGKKVRADDLEIPKERAAEFMVDPEQGARVKLYARGEETPRVELLVGRQKVIESTGAVRTFIKPVGARGIYRLQVSLAFARDPVVANWRSKDVVSIPRAEVRRLVVEHRGQAPIELVREGGEWRAAAPEPGMPLEDSVMTVMLRALEDLDAVGFLDGQTPETIALSEAAPHTLTVEHGEGQRTVLRLSELPVREQGKEGTWAAQVEGRGYVYEIMRYHGEQLAPQLTSLRSLTMKSFKRAELERISYASGVVLKRRGDSWQMIAPEALEQIDANQVDSALTMLTSLRAFRHVEDSVTEEAAGLSEAAKPDRVTIKTSNGEVILWLGGVESEAQGTRYARFNEAGARIFVLSGASAKRLYPSVDEWRVAAPLEKDQMIDMPDF